MKPQNTATPMIDSKNCIPASYLVSPEKWRSCHFSLVAAKTLAQNCDFAGILPTRIHLR